MLESIFPAIAFAVIYTPDMITKNWYNCVPTQGKIKQNQGSEDKPKTTTAATNLKKKLKTLKTPPVTIPPPCPLSAPLRSPSLERQNKDHFLMLCFYSQTWPLPPPKIATLSLIRFEHSGLWMDGWMQRKTNDDDDDKRTSTPRLL